MKIYEKILSAVKTLFFNTLQDIYETYENTLS